MASWQRLARNRSCLLLFPSFHPLSLVADPDGLLLEEQVLAALSRRGYDLLTFDDPIAFRYLYETRYRHQSTSALIVRTGQADARQLPYDLSLADSRVRALGLVLDNVDKMLHGTVHGRAELHALVRHWLERGELTQVVLAGTGGNGGGALVGARRLHNYGAQVQVAVTKPDGEFTPVPGQQLAILRRMGVPVGLDTPPATLRQAQDDARPALVIDGLIGYNLKGAPRGAAATLIRWASAAGAPILALDAPSGVDTTTGVVFDPAIRATVTMTLALPKAGLRAPGVEALVGELYLADISVPPPLYAGPALGLRVGHIFAQSDVVRLV